MKRLCSYIAVLALCAALTYQTEQTEDSDRRALNPEIRDTAPRNKALGPDSFFDKLKEKYRAANDLYDEVVGKSFCYLF